MQISFKCKSIRKNIAAYHLFYDTSFLYNNIIDQKKVSRDIMRKVNYRSDKIKAQVGHYFR